MPFGGHILSKDTSMTDTELLAQFVEEGSKDAFRQLVERHTSMVYAACLRSLEHTGMAEDASQAVFIVFARKAGSIRKGKPIGNSLRVKSAAAQALGCIGRHAAPAVTVLNGLLTHHS